MYLSLNLLKQFLPIVAMDTIDKIEEKLNSLGIEVEQVIKFPKIKNLAVGLIESMSKPKPDSKVNFCKVKIGSTTHDIICGGQNIKPGDKVVVAKVGAVLPGGKEIGKRNIMGIESQGMICGYNELNQVFCNTSAEENEWVVVLDKTLNDMKADPLKLIGMDDIILDLSIPSNRNDLNGIFWIVNELSPFYEFEFKNVLEKKEIPSKVPFVKKIDSSIKNYFFINFNVDEFDISWKVKATLLNSGLVPSNTILDLAKVSQILTGVPIFGFDSYSIKKITSLKLETKKEIIVDGNKILLAKGTNVLMANDEVLLIPGIGVNDKFKITKNSKDVCFFASTISVEEINKIINANKLATTDSKLAWRDFNANLVEYAYSNLLSILKVKFKNINVTKNSKIEEAKSIKLDLKKLNGILNTKLSAGDVKSILLSFGYKSSTNGYIPPVNRNDIENEMDIIEDVLKVYGINNISPTEISDSKIMFYDQVNVNLLSQIKTYFQSNGFFNVKTYNLCSKEELSFNCFAYKDPIKIDNPISNEREFMRISLVSGVLDTLSFNSRMANPLYPIYEIQDIYKKTGIDKHLIFATSQNNYNNEINHSFIKNDLFYLKEMVQNILSLKGLTPRFEANFNDEIGCTNDALNIYLNTKKIGYITRVSPNLLKQYKINTEALYICELNLSSVLEHKHYSKLIDSNISNQSVLKDITFNVDASVNLNEVYNLFKKQNLFKNYKIISEFKIDENNIAYTVKFEINQDNKEAQNFDNIINFFESNKLKVKK